MRNFILDRMPIIIVAAAVVIFAGSVFGVAYHGPIDWNYFTR